MKYHLYHQLHVTWYLGSFVENMQVHEITVEGVECQMVVQGK